MATSSAKRTGARSALTLLVSHAYATQAHHTVASTTSPRTAPSALGSAASKPVTWVIANTNTKSKKSSSDVTLVSSDAA